jgi:hypothetical protein
MPICLFDYRSFIFSDNLFHESSPPRDCLSSVATKHEWPHGISLGAFFYTLRDYFPHRLRSTPTAPRRDEPNNTNVPGSGVGDVVDVVM